MNTYKILFLFMFFALQITEGSGQQYSGTNIRGKVLLSNGSPAVNSSVDLYVLNTYNGQWVLLGSTITDPYGFYYFNWLMPNQYVLQVNRNKNYNISVIWIDYRYYSFQDIPILYY